jgi:hypothetical protein
VSSGLRSSAGCALSLGPSGCIGLPFDGQSALGANWTMRNTAKPRSNHLVMLPRSMNPFGRPEGRSIVRAVRLRRLRR